jgi:hypothetical protein
LRPISRFRLVSLRKTLRRNKFKLTRTLLNVCNIVIIIKHLTQEKKKNNRKILNERLEEWFGLNFKLSDRRDKGLKRSLILRS